MSVTINAKESPSRLLGDLRDLNLNFLLLAQKMINECQVTAKAQLGISDQVATLLGAMSASDLMRLASTSLSLCTLRFEDPKLWELATDRDTDPRLTALHASILGFRTPNAQKLTG